MPVISQGGVWYVKACDCTGWCTVCKCMWLHRVVYGYHRRLFTESWLGCRSRYLPCQWGKNKNNCFSRCRKLLLKSPFFYTKKTEIHVIQRRNEQRIQWRRQQSHQNMCFFLENGQPYTLLANAYPGACARYTQMHILMLSIPTHKCVRRQIWVN